MKSKKKTIILVSILIVLAVILIVIGVTQMYPQKFSLCTIKTYYGDEINDYNKNKKAFVIADYDKKAKIKVNGEEYKENQGFYKTGEYEIEINLNDKIEKKTIKINEIDKEKQNEYNIYITPETLPTLFASFDMIENKQIPSFVWFQREGTLNIEELKNMNSNITISEHVGIGDEIYVKEFIIPEIQKYVTEILRKDENAHFNVFVTAEFYWIEIGAFDTLGLREEQVSTTMYSCGTFDYRIKYAFGEEEKYDVYLEKKQLFEDILDKAKSNLFSEDVELRFLKGEDQKKIEFDYIILNALRGNVEYYLQFPELVKFADERVNEEIKKAGLNKISANERFNQLSKQDKQLFCKCINLDKQEFDEKYFDKEDGKYLIITGTRPMYGIYDEIEFKNIINQIVEKYGKEYILLYKPHPTAIPESSDTMFLEEKGIKILPGVMPIEAIGFIYDNLKLGGFQSSLYMSVDKGNTIFFICESKEDLPEPLNTLYDELFQNVEFISPKK